MLAGARVCMRSRGGKIVQNRGGKIVRSHSRSASSLSHVSEDGKLPKMVDVSGKTASVRRAHARSTLTLPPAVMQELTKGGAGGGQPTEVTGPKGPVFATAIIAGVMGAKRTSDLIPFCHPLPLEKCDITIELAGENQVVVDCHVMVNHKTGVEMEALTGASMAADISTPECRI